MTKHPSGKDLALAAGGDLSMVARWRLKAHLRHCAECSTVFEAERAAVLVLRGSVGKSLPADLDWERLSAEMKANIHLGLSAGECVEPVQRATVQRSQNPAVLGWQTVAMVASLTIVLTAGWFLGRSPNQPAPGSVAVLPTEGVLLESTREGVVIQGKGSMTFLHPNSERVATLAEWGGAMRARSVDSETGQVTISHVVAE